MIARVAVLALFLAACAQPITPPPPSPPPAFAALGLRSVAVGPVAYAVRQPDGQCSAFIDEEIRSALGRDLRRRGYDVFAVGKSVPRSFAPGPAPPLPGEVPPEVQGLRDGGDALLLVWLEEYWENSLCDYWGPKYLNIGAVGVLYAGSPAVEVWRGRARSAEQGNYSPQQLMWLGTSRLTDGLLQTLPAAQGGSGQR